MSLFLLLALIMGTLGVEGIDRGAARTERISGIHTILSFVVELRSMQIHFLNVFIVILISVNNSAFWILKMVQIWCK